MSTADSTICAVSTPAGAGMRGIVRLSGADAVRITARVFAPGSGAGIEGLPTYRAVEGAVHLPSFSARAPATLYLMRGPHSYTRENVVELHVPGNPCVLEATLDALVAQGARLAEPGEFTLRAFVHGRIDLTQAEAVAAAIQSNTQAELRLAVQQLRGAFGQRVAEVRDAAIRTLAEIEADLDFSDQDIPLVADDALLDAISSSLAAVDAMLSQERSAPIHRDAASVAICGRPNVGKSSLMNRLLGHTRAIVSHVSGTTRDLLDDLVEIDGIRFSLTDTPGLADYADGVTQRAVDQGRDAAARAQIVLLVIDRSAGLLDADAEIHQAIRAASPLLVLNKSDLPAAVEPEAAAARLGAPAVAVSCETGEGIGELRHALVRTITSAQVDLSASLAISNARHRHALERARERLQAARRIVAEGRGRELAAIELGDASAELGAILGLSMDTPEEILDQVFSQFCIGK